MATTIASYYNAQTPLVWSVSNAYTWGSTEYGETRASQTFQVIEGNWTVDKVYFKGNRTKLIGPTAGDITVEVRTTNESGSLLGSGTLDRTTVAYSPAAWYSMDISGVNLSNGNTYCLVWKCPYGYHNSDTHSYDSIYFINNAVGYADGVGQKYTALNGWEALDTPGDFFFIVTADPAAPEKPINPTPANEASDVTLDGTGVTWEDGGGATSYNVYHGTLSGFLTLLESGVTDTSYTLRNTNWPLYGAIQYWRVDAVNDVGTTTGDEWYFTTLIFYPPTPDGITWDDPGNDTGYSGTATGVNNMVTVRRLIGAADDCIWYEV